METTSSWWTCPDCDVAAELDGAEVLGGVAVPCPDCGAEMTLWRAWETAA